jgi:hypothetical protein
MLLADRFTYIHEPKTGGSFVTHVLSRLHGGLTSVPASRIRGPALRVGLPTVAFYPERLRAMLGGASSGHRKYGTIYNWNDHGTCSEIPRGYRSKTILGTARSPFETYVSMFLFGWWKRLEYVPQYERTVPNFRQRYRDFPDVTFKQYLELLHAGCTLPATRDLDDPTGPGFLTERFVRFYFRLSQRLRTAAYDPAPVLRKLTDSYVASESYRDEMFPVHFIHTSRLNEQLREFLLAVGYGASDLEFVDTLEHVLPVGGSRVELTERPASHDWSRYYTPELKELIHKRDRLIFSLFPELEETRDSSAPAR